MPLDHGAGRAVIERLVGWIKEIFRDRDPLDPVDFKISLESENPHNRLVAIEFENDDVTPMEFVVKILEQYFSLTRDNAVRLMLKLHREGTGRVEWMDEQSANLALKQIRYESSKRKYPLQCRIVAA